MSRERGIIFAASLIPPLLDGRKTVTRRLLRPQPVLAIMEAEASRALKTAQAGGIVPDGDTPRWQWKGCFTMPWPSAIRIECPYGVPGDRLWVREGIRRDADSEFSHFIADGAPTKADCWPWKNKALPSIHCPRGLSRITLDIVDVRAERLHEITRPDIDNEGVSGFAEFANKWDELHGEGSFDSDPWVWRIEFRATPSVERSDG